MNFASERANVIDLPGFITIDDIAETIRRAGYNVVLPDDAEIGTDAEQAAREAEIRDQLRKFVIGAVFTLPLFAMSILRDFEIDEGTGKDGRALSRRRGRIVGAMRKKSHCEARKVHPGCLARPSWRTLLVQEMSSESVDNGLEQVANLLGNLPETGVVDGPHRCQGIDGRHFDLAAGRFLDHHVAGEHGADLVFRL